VHRARGDLPVEELIAAVAGRHGITRRPCGPADGDFLLALYASTRAEELAATGWPAPERDAFVRMQFTLQDRHYRAVYPGAEHSVIVVAGRPAGRLIVDRGRGAVRVVDISLLPEHRGRGIGSGVLADVMAEAASTARPVRLSVALGNPARRLYERLGFTATDASGSHVEMEWRARA
jgi:ribosomal protein S18 acetylase RimI-like enzyme